MRDNGLINNFLELSTYADEYRVEAFKDLLNEGP